jgi:predicted Zn-dependent protease
LATTQLSHTQIFLPTQTIGQTEVPEIGSGIGLLDQQKEKLIGEKVYREVHRQMPTVQDAWLEDQFLQVFSGILSQTQLGQPIGLVVIKDPQINAFAVPGGLFALNTGLITSAKNLDEIAGVMAHEIAHVAQRHYSRSQEAFKGQGLLALAGILVGAAIASKADGDVGSAVMLGTQAALMDKQLSYSRNQEREADRIGMQFMYSAGYNPQSMADYFETMHRETSRVSFLPDFWLTHPLTTERMSEARLRANQLPKVKSKIYDLDFEILKLYTLVISNQATETQLQAFANQKNTAAQLALSKFYLERGDYTQAQAI